MYIYSPQPKQKCSKCGAIDNTESVTRDEETFIRCCSCGHEKLLCVTTCTDISETHHVYKLKPPPEVEEF